MKVSFRKNIIVCGFCAVVFNGCATHINTSKSSNTPMNTPEVSPTVNIAHETSSPIAYFTQKQAHEQSFKEHLEVLAVFTELTKLEAPYLDKIVSEKEQESRKKKTFAYVDRLNDNVYSLMNLAEMTRVFGIGNNEQFAAPVYDIAFFYCVKKIAIKHKDDKRIMSELKELKKYIIGGHTYGDFVLALNGQDPMFLYGKVPEVLPSEP